MHKVTSASLWKDGFFKFLKNRLAVLGLIFLLMTLSLAFVGPYFSPYDYCDQNIVLGAATPSKLHWFGTDMLGRDLLTRMLYGGRISFVVSIASTCVALLIGVTYGLISAWKGGNWDRVMMRTVDVIYPLPFTLLVMLLMVYCGKNMFLLFIAIGCVQWLTMARIVRNQVMILKNQSFIESARSLGQNSFGILTKHILPNLASLILVYTTIMIPKIMLEESFLSFIGMGIQPPRSSWGLLILDGANTMEVYPWLIIFPSIFFSLTLLSFNFIGDGLRDAFDPKNAILEGKR